MTSALHEEFDDYGNILRVADLTFTDTILGEGSYGTVRLARRRRKKSQSQLQSQPQLLNSNSTNGSHDKYKVTTNSIKYNKKHDSQVYNANANANTSNNNNNNNNNTNNNNDNNKEDELVAVKIYSKSVLHQIKELTKSSNPSHKNKRRMSIHDAYEKVEQEITIMKKMNHPNILLLYDIIDSIQSDTLYIVMEYLPLGNIMTFDPECMVFRKTITNTNTIKLGLTKDGCYQESYAALYFVDILHGLKYLHEHHICHSDLKPDNIFIDSRGVAKIGDFGVSHLFEEEIEVEHEYGIKVQQQEQQNDKVISHDHKDGTLTKREGTYSFWSPEMCNTKSTSYSGYESDIWACGICLYIFISGKLPFYDEDTSELFKLIINAKVQFDDQFDNPPNKFSISSKDLILSILQNDPNRSRRPSIDELLDHVFCKQAREQRISMLGGEMKNDMNMFLHSSCSSRQPCCTLL